MATETSSRYKIAAAGLFLAVMLGCGLVLLIEITDDRFTSADEILLQLPEEVVGQIPESPIAALGFNGNGNGNNKHHRRLLKHPEEQHAFAESFRNLRSSLLYAFKQANAPKVILITSAVPKEGKTTVATHFASSLAMGGSKVLLIDADLRRSSLHQTFGVPLAPGLREVLGGLVPANNAISPVKLSDSAPGSSISSSSWSKSPVANGGVKVPGSDGLKDSQLSTLNSQLSGLDSQPSTLNSQLLFLLPAGTTGSSSSETFLRGHLRELLADLSKQFDYIVIDSAPVLATDDAGSLGPIADGAFMVVRSSFTSSRMAKEALDRLHKRGVRVLGVVYNRAEQGNDYYYRYSAHYRAGELAAAPSAS